MKKSIIGRLLIPIVMIGLCLSAQTVSANDAPHNSMDKAELITCSSCHYPAASPPAWVSSATTTGDTTKWNLLCVQCHSTGNLPHGAKYEDIQTHSSEAIQSNKYGNWRVECRICHSPHFQQQVLSYSTNTTAYLRTGTVSAMTTAAAAVTSTITDNAASFTPGEYVGYLLIPNTAYPTTMYRIQGNTDKVITVYGAINPYYAAVNKPYTILYGKMVNQTINGAPVKFFNKTGDNSFGKGSTGVADAVCQICHTQTESFKSDGTQEMNFHPAGVAGVQPCTNCHPHKYGFKASCGNCHNAPPATGRHALHAGSGRIAYGSTEVRSNAGAYGFSCGICHNGSHMNTGDQSGNPHSVEVAFAGIAAQDPASGSASYAPAANSVDAPGTGWTFNYSDGTCSNVYCHGNYPGSGKNAVVSFNTGSASCGSCHNATNTLTPSSGTHTMHAFEDYTYFRCTLCHYGIVTGGGPSYTIADKSRHVNGYVDWQFDPADLRTAGGGYSIATGSAVPSNGTTPRVYGACSTVYCHSNVQPDGGVGAPSAYAAPAWGASMRSCTACHGSGGAQHDPDMSSGSHVTHLSYSLTVSSRNTKCVICHTRDPQRSVIDCWGCHESPAHIMRFLQHANYEVNVAFASPFSNSTTTYSGTPVPGDGYGACSNTYCHGNGASVATGAISSNTTSSWGSGPLSCNSCHEYPPAYSNGSPKANTHAKHGGYTCNNCHYTTTNTGAAISSRTTHVNKLYSVDPGTGRTFSYVFAPSGGTCSNISCHFNGTAAWGGSVPCGGCHAVTAGTLTTGSHQAHLSTTVFRGPNGVSAIVTCDTCHGAGATAGTHSGHGNGSVTFADGNALSATTACDTCHSPGGDYNGVGDPAIGAKPNWTVGVYSGNDLAPGKEKWCAGCHDKVPSVINSLAVSAPNVVGDESGSFTYGSGWGYYKTGHGLPSSATYPASGGVTAGAGQGCGACHDLTAKHIDGLARTFDDGGSSTLDPGYYRAGYRLKKVAAGTGTGSSTEEPLLVPWPITTANDEDNYRLCVMCHSAGPFTNASNTSTNMLEGATNLHQYHLVRDLRYPADWSGGNNSKMTCMSCHNVHGSTRLAMVNDGKLTNREPGFRIWYYNPDLVTYTQMSTSDPYPTNIKLAASTGSLYIGESAANLCSHCHGTGQTSSVTRTPYQSVQQAPVLSWTGETGYVSDGAQPDSGPGGSAFTFRVSYADQNNDAPVRVELWIDRNDNGDYEDAGEKVTMSETNFGDTNRTDGKLYAATVMLNKAGDNALTYRFYAEQSGGVAATGEPTADQSVTVTNALPVLSWTGEHNYTVGGVQPLIGGNGATFEFRVMYTDADNELPAAIQVWIDKNDDGDYDDPGEKIDMAKADGQDNDYRNGEVYAAGVAIPYAGDGSLSYRFHASDGIDAAVAGAGPVGSNSLTVLTSVNTPPWLEWETGAPCLTEGVRPQQGPTGGDFEFRVVYVDWENTAPGAIQVWVDKNGDDDYDDPGEKIGLTPAGGDGNYKNGEVYTSGTVTTLVYTGEGEIHYRFVATDGTDAATSGEPVSEHEVKIVNTAFKVRPAGGTGWYGTIANAVSATTGTARILVYPGAAYTAATYGNITLMSKPSVTIQSVCGPDLTTISANGAAVQGVLIQNAANDALDGFTVTGGTSYGVYALNAPAALVTNCTVTGNPTGINVNNSNPARISASRITNNTIRGINAVNGSGTVISDCEIDGNGGGETSGAGIYFNGGSHSVTGSLVRNNRATGSLAASGNGGGMYFMSNTATTVATTTITGNTAVKSGGGVYLNNAAVDFDRCVMTGNSADATGGMISTMTTTANVGNSIIAGNSAPKGGAVYVNSFSANLTFTNSTFADNQATSATGGVFGVCNAGAITVRNSIFWNNISAGLGDNAYKECGVTNFMTITDSDVTTGPGSIDGGTVTTGGNLDPAQDPLFAGGGDYHLRSGSPAMDRANAAYAPAVDIDGQARPNGPADDMGADEYVP